MLVRIAWACRDMAEADHDGTLWARIISIIEMSNLQYYQPELFSGAPKGWNRYRFKDISELMHWQVDNRDMLAGKQVRNYILMDGTYQVDVKVK